MAKTIYKDEFIRIIAERAGFTQGDVRTIFNEMASFMEECVRNGVEINVKGFGHLEYNSVSGYKGYDPVNECEIEVPESIRVNFKLAENIRCAHKQ